MLEQLQLLWLRSRFLYFRTMIDVYVGKLFVSNTHHSHAATFGHEMLYALHVNVGIGHTSAVAHIDGKLKHGEAIHLQLSAEKLIGFLILTRLRREIKKY